ncbi:hypothetical protein YTPLAS72_02870 [Nitrospira sp.]|nr:hypothetical protein YTPLAS72_02870 [Nitrospira sp.]
MMQMVAHGLSTGGLFLLAGALEERYQTREMGHMGGLWSVMPRLATMTLFFACASLGLPGLANFIGEFLVYSDPMRLNHSWSSWRPRHGHGSHLFFGYDATHILPGANKTLRPVPDLSNVAFGTVLVIAVLQIWLGLYPR